MDHSRTRDTRAFLRLIAGTVCVLGLVSAINALIISNNLGNDIFKPTRRDVASTTTRPRSKASQPDSTIVEINCRKKLQTVKLTTQTMTARIFFKNCPSIGRPINQSNQSQGDLFPLQKNQWTSDFISLSEGQNSLRVPLGEEVQIIEITRKSVENNQKNKAL